MSLTGYKIKIVERAGAEQILGKAETAEDNAACCVSKSKTGKNFTQDCTRRSLCYKIWCLKCVKDGEKMIDNIFNNGKVREKMKKEMNCTNILEKRAGVSMKDH